MIGGLRAVGLARRFAGRTVLDRLDLSVDEGEVVGLLGPNGAGKTTCFRILAGLDLGGEGVVTLNGTDLAGLPLWRRVRAGLAYLPQESSVFRTLSALDNLRVPLELRLKGDVTASAAALLQEAGLTHLGAQRAGSLSGGERRRLEIARCLATDPRVLLLDEPFAGVDPVAVADLQRFIRRLAATRGVGVLVTDHAVRETLGTCDRAVVVDAGRVMVSGAPREVAEDPVARARYLGVDFVLPPG